MIHQSDLGARSRNQCETTSLAAKTVEHRKFSILACRYRLHMENRLATRRNGICEEPEVSFAETLREAGFEMPYLGQRPAYAYTPSVDYIDGMTCCTAVQSSPCHRFAVTSDDLRQIIDEGHSSMNVRSKCS